MTLPAGVNALTLTAVSDRLVVGGQTTADSAPRLVALDAWGGTSDIPLVPRSGYGPLTRWLSVVSDGSQITAVGGAYGGAHSNVRWTTWHGTLAGVEEQPQPFDTFGGWGAGELVDAVSTPTGTILVGTWGSANAGLDGAEWTESSGTWTRLDPAGTALQSTSDVLVGPRSATADGAGILVAGSALLLAPGALAQRAAVWRSSGLTSGWRRIDLPDSGAASEALSAHCATGKTGETAKSVDTCLVAGRVDGVLALWRIDGDAVRRLGDVPPVALTDTAVPPEPVVTTSGREVVLAPEGGGTLVLTRDPAHDQRSEPGSESGSRSGSSGPGWTRLPGPPGIPLAAAVHGARLMVVCRTGEDAATLWSASLQ